MQTPTPSSSNASAINSPTVFGHPAGLFTLFFAEMWERFSYYGMRALLLLYMVKSSLKFAESDGNAIYGAYTALVYMTPFFGGMLADRLLGQRKAVILGGILMACGHLLMTIEHQFWFFFALSLLICGNGLFKPNISTIVGTLYPAGSQKRDAGFTIFYMGVNLGAALAPLLCGYVGETYGWHLGFGLATVGMMVGVAVFVAPRMVTAAMILCTALVASLALFLIPVDNWFPRLMNVTMGAAMIISSIVACVALSRGGLPAEAGLHEDPAKRRHLLAVPSTMEWLVYLGIIPAIFAFTLLVSGFATLRNDHKPMTLLSKEKIDSMAASSSPLVKVAAVIAAETSRPANLTLFLAGLGAFGYLVYETVRLPKIARERMYVVLVLTLFSTLFWAFFEQAGTSLNQFTDRNVERVAGANIWSPGGSESVGRKITAADVGTTIQIEPTQKQLGYHNGDAKEPFTMNQLDELRGAEEKSPHPDPRFTVPWKVAPDNVGMIVATRYDEVATTSFQAVNAICILLFGLPFSAMWLYLGRRRIEPSAPVKFSLALFQLGLGFVVIWYGTTIADPRGMVPMIWLLLAYTLHTTAELCLSPVGLSMVTRLSPKRLVSTVMGTWFLATAFSQAIASVIAQFAVRSEGAGESLKVPIPNETLHPYGDVFWFAATCSIGAGVVCLLLSPILSKWMHPNELEEA
jgi:POT family proton-dependent oligopeptide transporter